MEKILSMRQLEKQKRKLQPTSISKSYSAYEERLTEILADMPSL
jgi:hypothetical protein